MTEAKKNDNFVMPGSFLTVAEEFLPGKNTYEDKEGNIYSAVAGEVEFDNEERVVAVEKKGKTPSLIEAGTIVYGSVMLVKSNVVVLILLKAENEDRESIFHETTGSLIVARVSQDYIKDLTEVFKKGDLVKARVIDVTPYSVELATNSPELGVIRAFCSKCRHELRLFNKDLKCINCGATEKRKIANDYSLR